MIVGDIVIKINFSNKKHFINKGYDINVGDDLIPQIKDINKGSHTNILCECDNCKTQKYIEFRTYYKITNKLTDKYYCKKCSYIKNKKTNLIKYGVEHPMKNQDIVNKILRTNNERYGENSASKLDKTKKKQEKTNLIKYGCKSPLQNKKIQQKYKKTMVEKYGVEYPIQNTNIKETIKETNLERYGYDNPMKNTIIHNKMKNTMLMKYGYDNPMKDKSQIDKINKTKSINLIKKFPSIINVDYDKKTLTMVCDNGHNHIFKIDINVFQNRKSINTIICNICNNGVSSGLEIQLTNFIKKNYKEEIVENDRKILNGKELDIYLPRLKLAFEFNGVYWHNELHKPNDYHNIKTNLCLEKDIQLIHIYEDDWIYKQGIIKSMILNKLKVNPIKIYGRKTKVRGITDNKLVRSFLNNNHIQGFVGSKVKLGLFFEDELVSLMTFGGLRQSMNSKSKSDNDYEMLRFCNKLNTNVLGGASKLFKYFIRNYNPESVASYADRSYSNGNLYKQLGFELNHITKPNYYYVIDGIKHYRFGFRKDILIKEGYDSNKTEHDIMLERKIYRIYNSGNYKFLFHSI